MSRSDPAPSPSTSPEGATQRPVRGDGDRRGHDHSLAGAPSLRATAHVTASLLGALAFASTFGVFAFGLSNYERIGWRRVYEPGCGMTGAIVPVDWTLSQAHAVVRGRVIHVEWHPNPSNVNGRAWRISTVEVAEAVKGSALDRV